MRSRVALLGVMAALGLAWPAHADPDPDAGTDAAFLAAVQAAGITYNRPDQAIIIAKTVCELIAQGKPSPQVLEILKERNPNLTTEYGTLFVGISAHSYCPHQLVQSGAAPTG